MDDLEDGEPIERFADDERGYEAATLRWKKLSAGARRDAWLGRLKWIVLVSALLWALSGALTGVLIFEVSSFDGRGLFETLFKWAQIANSVAQPLTLGGFALYVMLWLEGRRDR